jgi:hypothetical protein
MIGHRESSSSVWGEIVLLPGIGHPIATIQCFYAAQVNHMVLASYDARGKQVKQHLSHVCRSDGKIYQRHTLHPTLHCSEKALVKVLKYMERLQVLDLSIIQPWADVLELLAAKPSTKDWPTSHSANPVVLVACNDGYHVMKRKDWCSTQTRHVGILSVGNKRVDSVTNVELRKSDNKHYDNDTQSESPYERGMKQEDETLTTGIMYLPRVFPNGIQGQVLGY